MKKKINEKDVRALWIFCAVTATITDVLCVLFRLNVVQNHWFLNFTGACSPASSLLASAGTDEEKMGFQYRKCGAGAGICGEPDLL